MITIEDHGHGIAPNDLPKVFDPFFTTKPVGEGTGLGLSITHQIIHAHHGDIQIDSTLEKGTRVRLRLPLEPLQSVSPDNDARTKGTGP